MEFEISAVERVGDRVTISVGVPAALRYLEGHFPGDPIVPGVAQLVPLAEAQARAAWPDLGPSRGVRRLKFMEALRPGEALTLELERSGETVRFSIWRADRECTRGALAFRPG